MSNWSLLEQVRSLLDQDRGDDFDAFAFLFDRYRKELERLSKILPRGGNELISADNLVSSHDEHLVHDSTVINVAVREGSVVISFLGDAGRFSVEYFNAICCSPEGSDISSLEGEWVDIHEFQEGADGMFVHSFLTAPGIYRIQFSDMVFDWVDREGFLLRVAR
jgi:hypothetical protein